MAWTYDSSTGKFSLGDGPVLTVGYSGRGEGLNNPALERVHNVGPIPRGFFHIGDAEDSPTHGPIAMHLTPINGTDTFGRSGFMAHGDHVSGPPHMASLGCIILPRWIRVMMAASADRVLQVV